MAQQIINLGTVANDGTGDSIRIGGDKINDNFTELYTTKLDSVGAGTNITIDNTDPINPIINATGESYTFENGLNESSGTVTWYEVVVPDLAFRVPILEGTGLTIGDPTVPYGVTVGKDGANTPIGLNGSSINIISTGTNTLSSDGNTIISSDSTVSISSTNLELSASSEFNISTPSVIGVTAISGQLLTLINEATGEVEFTGGQIEESASFTLDDTYLNKVVIITNGASNINITVDTSLSNGFKCGFIQYGTGTVTFIASGTTLRSANGLIIDGQYSQAFIEKRNAGTNELFVLGNLTT